MANGNDGGPRQRSAELLTALFAIVTGSMAFLPSVLGAVRPPYILDWLLVAFWVLGCTALLFLAMALYVIRFSSSPAVPQRRTGVGFWAAIAALIALAVYVGANGWQDRTASPEIQSVDISPLSPESEETVRLSAAATTQSGKDLNYHWSVDGRSVGDFQIVFTRAPQLPGSHSILVVVDDGQTKHAVRHMISLHIKPKGRKMADREKMLQAAIANAMPLLQRRFPKQYQQLTTAFEAGTLPQLAADDFDPDDPRSQQLLVQGAFLRAVEALPPAQLQLMLKGMRPCCSKYPGTWPFCNPDC
jgi:hypothetical protein